ncbi:uroporphyrinogen-III synthase [Limimonas halophila]|uniref:Uroporphyrinogen-III synthase n=1 Tax=Limimonas halophila TaxID=1082479 RepID=A0A1G7T4P3_9PROT|nr:uroporphyrinogen-III synthase [Limimonas halophila]SDG30293.1 uroporphyrinogen-III synthase [Limimonas halophila]
MHVLVTRPQADAEDLLTDLHAHGHTAVLAPMLEVHVTARTAPDVRGVQALLFTSANGVRAFTSVSDRRDLPVFAVGKATAEAARGRGFQHVEAAGGDAASLAAHVRARLTPAEGALYHAAGTVTRGALAETLRDAGFTVHREALYDCVPVTDLPADAHAALANGTLDGVLFFSPRTADTFVSVVRSADLGAACRRLHAVCLSPAVAERVRALTWAGVHLAARPERTALLAVLSGLGDGEAAAPSREADRHA